MKKEETLDHQIKATWHAISRMYNQQAAKYGGTMSVGYVLLNISTENGASATKIAPQMGLESRSLTRILKSMEEKGLIYRAPDPNDKRGVLVFLTDSGIEMKNRARETVLRFNEVTRESIPAKKLDVFFEVLKSINGIIEKNNIYESVANH
ncbi:MAG TPA: MarR family transcriptional regulator [Cyclobacteriaceae bacterium]|jgi:DNA-binding MarR family transcriptional regulator|nr:MarR family transcriptional regulator [Cyclobacteriaceae bacterium]HNP06346.1 MarR family transcriptional regulator [Cyclobacteriaceae bacterium]HRK55024.1 MarR family transcriptional regulator [Cyclobacteriaceae bacterium]